jgi:hypothetical protein
MGRGITPGDLVALRAVQRDIPLGVAQYLRLESLGLITQDADPPGWIVTSRGDLISPTSFYGY